MSTPSAGIATIDLDELIGQVDQLPALPEIVTDLLRNIDREDLDISVLARKIAHDQTLTAKTLRFANSSYYGAKGKVTTIQQAITLLGMTTMRQLITAAALAVSFPDNQCKGFDFKAFWRHSMATAVCAQSMARHLHLNQDFAFTAGLLHDIGRLVLVTRFPAEYEQAMAWRARNDAYVIEAERAVLGIDHVQAGHALAVRWHFPEVIDHAILGHHKPDPIGRGSIASLINVANAIVHALDLAGEEDDVVPPVALGAWYDVGLDADVYLQIFRETELEFEKISSVL
ncbi:MAG TPA: HDOD domain-containing protein [Paucimonas sp.]|nr:HDOD domain-containing protein [Paucimonas sp.]